MSVGYRVCVCSALATIVKYFSKRVVSPATYESSSCSAFSPVLDVFWLCYFRHSSGCVVVSHCGFNFYFSTDEWSSASLLSKIVISFNNRILAWLGCGIQICEENRLGDEPALQLMSHFHLYPTWSPRVIITSLQYTPSALWILSFFLHLTKP